MSQPTEPLAVPALDLKAQYQSIRDEIDAVVRRVIESQYFILGPEVAEFEAEAATYCGSKHAVGCASGSDALLLPLMALGIGPGDEVVTTPYSFFATAGAVWRLGAQARVRRHRARHVQHRPVPDRRRDHAEDEGDHPRPPLRPVGRHGRDQRDRRRRGQFPSSRTRPRRSAPATRAAARGRSATSRPSASIRRRTSAASATRGWSRPTTRPWPSQWRGSASTGWNRSTTTTRSASTRGSMRSRRRCFA